MKDTLRDSCDDEADCVRNCCVSPIIAPIFFVIFVLMAQFVLVNVVVAVLMKHLEESHKQIEDDEYDMEELEREMQQVHKFEEEQALCMQLAEESSAQRPSIPKVLSLPSDFTYSSPVFERHFNTQRRSTLQNFSHSSQCSNSDYGQMRNSRNNAIESAEIEMGEIKPKVKSKTNNIKKEVDRRSISSSSQTPRSKSKLEQEISTEDRQSTVTLKSKPVQQASDNAAKGGNADQLILNDYKTTNFYQKPNAKQIEKNANKNIADKLTSSKDSIAMVTDPMKTTLYRRSSLKFDYGNSNASNTLLSLPKTQSVGRSGSCRQLFKQHAMDDEADIDENSLLLPVLNKSQPQLEIKNGKETSLFTKPNTETN